MSFAGAGLAFAGSAQAQPTTQPPQALVTASGKHTSLGPLKQSQAGVLNVGYAEVGPVDGSVVVLLHGCDLPLDIRANHSWRTARLGTG
jgi:hypothetical protein